MGIPQSNVTKHANASVDQTEALQKKRGTQLLTTNSIPEDVADVTALLEMVGYDRQCAERWIADGAPELPLVSPEPIDAPAPEAQIAEFLRRLFYVDLVDLEGVVGIEMRCLKAGTRQVGPRNYYATIASFIEAALKFRHQWDVYVGVGLRWCPVAFDITRCTCPTKGDDHVLTLSAAWVDLDVQDTEAPPSKKPKPYASKAAALAALEGLPAVLHPQLLVDSGGGLQAYWRQNRGTANVDQVIAINRTLNARLQGDTGANSIDRILRVPGTFNHKYGTPRPVTLLRSIPGAISLDELQTRLVDPTRRYLPIDDLRPQQNERRRALLAAADGRYRAYLTGRHQAKFPMIDVHDASAQVVQAMVEVGYTDSQVWAHLERSGLYPRRCDVVGSERFARLLFERDLMHAQRAAVEGAVATPVDDDDADLEVTERYPYRLADLLAASGGKYQRILNGDYCEYGNDASDARYAVLAAMIKRHFTDGEIGKTLEESALLRRAYEEKGARIETLIAREVAKLRQTTTPFDEDPGDPAYWRTVNANNLTPLETARALPPDTAQPMDRPLVRQPVEAASSSSRGRTPVIKSGAELLQRVFAEPRFAVPGLLQEGVNLFAGKPKTGKSWLALGIAVEIALGGLALGSTPVTAGTVLYLALEDSERRLQDRLRKVLNGRALPPEFLYETRWPRLDEGGADQLRIFLTEHPDTRLIVIDTLKMIRPRERGRASAYAQDYEAIEPLGDIGREFGTAIKVLHHTRKLNSDDPMDTISGTLGLSGAADAMLVLQRPRQSDDATLTLTGRDMDERSVALRWQRETFTWQEVGDAVEAHLSEERKEIIALLRFAAEGLTPTAVATTLGWNRSTTKTLLWKMGKDGTLIVSDGKYSVPPTAA